MKADDPSRPEPGRRALPAILGLVSDRRARAGLVGAAREFGGIEFHDDATALRRALRDGDASVVLVDAVDKTGAPVWPLVVSIRADFPMVPVIAYCDPKRTASADILALARAGVNELLISGLDDVRPALERVVGSADRQCMADEVLRLVAARLPAGARDTLTFFLRHAADSGSVATAAAALGVDRKTLWNRLAAVRLPPPSELSAWSRLLIAARRLDAPGRAADQVALELNFPSGSAFRNMLRRYTGLTPTALRARGGSRHLTELFIRRLFAGEREPPEPEGDGAVRRPRAPAGAPANVRG
jgi:AraC-like DNA-binding protein